MQLCGVNYHPFDNIYWAFTLRNPLCDIRFDFCSYLYFYSPYNSLTCVDLTCADHLDLMLCHAFHTITATDTIQLNSYYHYY